MYMTYMSDTFPAFQWMEDKKYQTEGYENVHTTLLGLLLKHTKVKHEKGLLHATSIVRNYIHLSTKVCTCMCIYI